MLYVHVQTYAVPHIPVFKVDRVCTMGLLATLSFYNPATNKTGPLLQTHLMGKNLANSGERERERGGG